MKGLQSYFGISDERGDEIIHGVTESWLANLKNGTFQDVNELKHKVFLDVCLVVKPNCDECGLIGILIEHAYNATLQKPQKTLWGKLK